MDAKTARLKTNEICSDENIMKVTIKSADEQIESYANRGYDCVEINLTRGAQGPVSEKIKQHYLSLGFTVEKSHRMEVKANYSTYKIPTMKISW